MSRCHECQFLERPLLPASRQLPSLRPHKAFPLCTERKEAGGGGAGKGRSSAERVSVNIALCVP